MYCSRLRGIHGPEVQFLGRSLPVSTGLVPFATSVAGAALGCAKAEGKEPPEKAGEDKAISDPQMKEAALAIRQNKKVQSTAGNFIMGFFLYVRFFFSKILNIFIEFYEIF